MKNNMTAKEIAKLAHVSQSAVSRAFLKNASISSDKRQRILKIANQYGFRPNAMASSLITRKSKMIGLVMAYMGNMFYPYVMEYFSEKLRKEGYHILLFLGDESGSADSIFRDIIQYQIDGIILASTVFSSKLFERCTDMGIPVLMFNRFSLNSDESTIVATDNFEGGRTIGHFLAAGGHRKIAYIAGLEASSTNHERETGFNSGLKENGLKVYKRGVSDYNLEKAKQVTRDMFKGDRSTYPDAVFAANDHVCFGVMDVLKFEMKLRIPEDVSLVGFDNVPIAEWDAFSLTTFEQPYREMVNTSVRIILDQIGSEKIVPQKVIFNSHLIVRESAKIPEGVQIKDGRKIWKRSETLPRKI